MDVQLRRWLPVLLVAVALVAAGVAGAAGTGVAGDPVPPPEAQASVEPGDPSGPPESVGSPSDEPLGAQVPEWLNWLLAAVFLGLVVAVIGVFLYVGVRWLLTERVARREISDQAASQPEPDEAEAEQVRDAVRAGLADLDAGGDARRAVIACWLRLERVAAAAGTARLAADTPADLVARLLAAHRVSDRALEQLADAYRQARYAPAEVADALVVLATRALGDVDAQLAVRWAGRTQDPAAAESPVSAAGPPAEPR